MGDATDQYGNRPPMSVIDAKHVLAKPEVQFHCAHCNKSWWKRHGSDWCRCKLCNNPAAVQSPPTKCIGCYVCPACNTAWTVTECSPTQEARCRECTSTTPLRPLYFGGVRTRHAFGRVLTECGAPELAHIPRGGPQARQIRTESIASTADASVPAGVATAAAAAAAYPAPIGPPPGARAAVAHVMPLRSWAEIAAGV